MSTILREGQRSDKDLRFYFNLIGSDSDDCSREIVKVQVMDVDGDLRHYFVTILMILETLQDLLTCKA